MPPAIIGAAIVAGGSIIASKQGSKAAEGVAAAGERGAEAGIAEQRRQFDVATGLQRPALEAGDLARQELLASLGLSGQEAEGQFFDRFKETRGQQFLRQQQEKATTRNAAALGQRLGGNVLTALQEQAEGRAAGRLGEFQNRLASLAGAGQTAATQTGQFGQQTGANVANLQQAGAQARASGILGQNQALQQGISGVTGAIGQLPFFGAQTPSTVPPPPSLGPQFPLSGSAGFGQNFGQNFTATAFGGG